MNFFLSSQSSSWHTTDCVCTMCCVHRKVTHQQPHRTSQCSVVPSLNGWSVCLYAKRERFGEKLDRFTKRCGGTDEGYLPTYDPRRVHISIFHLNHLCARVQQQHPPNTEPHEGPGRAAQCFVNGAALCWSSRSKLSGSKKIA